MNEPTLKEIYAELSEQLIGRKFGKIFPLAKLQLAIDFRLKDGNYLFISVEPNSPRIYLIKRKLKELENQKFSQSSFVSFLRKRLANSVPQNIEKIENERIIKLFFLARNELGVEESYTLVVQLTGRSSNLFLLDEKDFILDSLRETFGEGQEIANRYSFPNKSELQKTKNEESFPKAELKTLSETLDGFYLQKQQEQKFQAISQSAKSSLNKELKKQNRLKKKLNQDLENHGDAEKWKRFGDLLLANLVTAERVVEKVFVIDYFDENTPKIEIEVDENDSLTESAEKYFKRYTKARNAKEEISKRLEIVEKEIEKLQIKQQKLEEAIEEKDLDLIETFLGKRKRQKNKKEKKDDSSTIAREFISSDGFEILVGKRSKDNDYLTFRIAKSLDTWLHAADYPGSHVVIRNPNRQEIPKKTLLEAAQLAAFFSKAKNEATAAVHYTQKKFVNKPKGTAAGLVSLASFKTILVKPKVFEQKK